jgi:hypothetical protein
VLLLTILKVNYFKNSISDVSANLFKLFGASKLMLNLDKTSFLESACNNKTCINLNIGYDDTRSGETGTARFFGLQINNKVEKTH